MFNIFAYASDMAEACAEEEWCEEFRKSCAHTLVNGAYLPEHSRKSYITQFGQEEYERTIKQLFKKKICTFQVKLLLLGCDDTNSSLSLLPSELIRRIAVVTTLLPFPSYVNFLSMFTRQINNTEQERNYKALFFNLIWPFE